MPHPVTRGGASDYPTKLLQDHVPDRNIDRSVHLSTQTALAQRASLPRFEGARNVSSTAGPAPCQAAAKLQGDLRMQLYAVASIQGCWSPDHRDETSERKILVKILGRLEMAQIEAELEQSLRHVSVGFEPLPYAIAQEIISI